MKEVKESELGTVLVVDDQPQNLRVLAQLLTMEGYLVQVARSGDLALKSIERQAPDLILLDVDMPVMSGFDVCERLKKDPATSAIPILFVSAMEEADTKISSFKCGGVDYITKPFEAGEILARVSTHLQISRLQKALKGTVDQLEERNQRLEMFGNTLAHDLRSHLCSVLYGSQLLMESETDGEAGGENRDIAASVHDAGRKMEDIVSALLFLATKDKGAVVAAPTKMELVAEECLKGYKDRVKELDGKIRVDHLPDCRAHAPWIRRIFDNYISNAVKFGGVPPEIRISSEVVDTDLEVPRHRYWIEDNGRGIPEDNLPELFEPYSRLDPDRPDGVGIGLSLVKKIAEAMDGSVGVESEIGKGSRFYVELPG